MKWTELYFLSLYLTVIYASRKCGTCSPGYFVNGCKTNTTANCESCPPDSYKLGTNSLTRCTRCTDCAGRNNIEIQKCNSTHDRQCRCKHDYWYDTGALFCSQCSACRKGKGVVKECGLTADTKCQRCTRGVTFSPVHSKTDPCQPCKKCGDNEDLIKPCTRRVDTECRPIPVKKEFQLKNKSKWPDNNHKENTTTEPTTTIVENTPTLKTEAVVVTTSVSLSAIKQKDNSKANTLHIVLYVGGTFLGLLVIAIIIIVVLRYRRKSTHRKRTRNQISAPSPTSTLKVAKESVSIPSTTPLMKGYSDKLLRDVSYSLIDDLSRHLNPKGRWKTLAGKLNFSSKDIENFQLEPTSATEVMLQHWGQRKGSTLYHLYEVLKNLKWLVEADMVSQYL